MNNGWIKLHRQLQDHKIWNRERFTYGQAWVDLLMLANHEGKTFAIRGIDIEIPRGSIAYSQQTLAEKWRWNFKTVMKFFLYLEKEGMAEYKRSNLLGLLKINNYNQYQLTGVQNGEQNGEQNTDRTENRTETNKKDKNEKKEKNVVRSETESLVETITTLCQKSSIRSEISSRGLDLLVERYVGKIHMKVEVQHAIAWLVTSNEKTGQRRVCTTGFVGNWFKKAQEIQKRDQLKQLEWKEEQNNPAMAARRKKKEAGFDVKRSVQDFISSQSQP